MSDNAKFDRDRIHDFWTEQARSHAESPRASWSDICVIEKEIDEIAARLEDGDRVLDVGCGNGYSTVALASRKRIRIRGLDYVSEMIRAAPAGRAPRSARG